MTAFQEFISAFALFAVSFIVIPVSVFATDIIKDYMRNMRKEDRNHDMGAVSRQTQKR